MIQHEFAEEKPTAEVHPLNRLIDNLGLGDVEDFVGTDLDTNIFSQYSPNYSTFYWESQPSSSSSFGQFQTEVFQSHVVQIPEVSPCQSADSYSQSRKRGRPSFDWFNEDHCNKLLESANGDPVKEKQIRNNIASGRYRQNKKMKVDPMIFSENEIAKLESKNAALKRKVKRNAEWIKKIETIILRRNF